MILLVLVKAIGKEHLLLNHPVRVVARQPAALLLSPLADRDLGQANILHDGPDDRQTARLGGESVDLIGALPHITKQALNGIRAADVAMHDGREGIKGQQMLLVFAQAAHRFGIALAIFGLEGRQIEQRIFFLLLLPDACQFSSDFLLLALGNGVHDIALFVHQAALPRRRWKEGGNRRKQSIMSIRDEQINPAYSAIAQIL